MNDTKQLVFKSCKLITSQQFSLEKHFNFKQSISSKVVFTSKILTTAASCVPYDFQTTANGIETVRFIGNKLWEINSSSLKGTLTLESFRKDL